MAPRRSWQELDRGPAIPGGSSREFLTGSWRTGEQPLLDLVRCTHCMLCWLYCPDSSILVANGRVTGIDFDHCKGCGICAEVCPVKVKAITMVDEVPQ